MFKEQVPHACEIPPAILHLLSLLGSVSALRVQVLIGGIPVLVARESPEAARASQGAKQLVFLCEYRSHLQIKP